MGIVVKRVRITDICILTLNYVSGLLIEANNYLIKYITILFACQDSESNLQCKHSIVRDIFILITLQNCMSDLIKK